ncbi:FAD-dependent oxidoreductase domain-containing protein 2-like [Ptychodera flava]|uniref:FAD-dependent oxidoreductase domain-containing protein 2-like n=1 Tax=Ptychodera flava TaxID=63121 RepID=UPI00396AA826
MANTTQMKTDYEYLIVGAGPSGVQMAYFMEKNKMDYLVLERADGPGSFYRKYPRHRTLISINKKYNCFPEPEFNFRHDWNSLINDEELNPLLFTNYTEELFPKADLLVTYLEDFCKKYKTNIRYNTEVKIIHRDEVMDGQNSTSRFTVKTENGPTFTSRVLLMATGPAMPHDPKIEGLELVDSYQDHSLDLEEYKNKKVCILGGGNSAFEVADHIAGVAGLIHMFNRHPVKFAWDTHFVGHLRAVNNNVLDMYHLKSLHALRKCDATRIWKTDDGKFSIEYDMHLPNWDPPGTGRFVTNGYDKIINCTGWRFLNPALFDETCQPSTHTDGKYPVLDEHWQTTIKDMYFIGTPMQSRDRRAASGFIHGFRYNVRSLCHMLRNTYNGIALPAKVFSPIDQEEVCRWIVKHVSVVSALYQLGQGFLCDVVLIKVDKDTKTGEEKCAGKVEYIRELPQAWVRQQSWFQDAPLAVLISIEDTIAKYPELKATEFFTPGDANVTNCKCSPFPQAVFRVFKEGKLVDDLFIGGSLVVRADTRNFDGDTNPERYVNKVKNLFHRHTGIGKGGFYEQLFTPDMWPKVYRPWSQEEIEEQRKTEMAKADKKYECSMSVVRYNQVDIADM